MVFFASSPFVVATLWDQVFLVEVHVGFIRQDGDDGDLKEIKRRINICFQIGSRGNDDFK
jgi:hypothetical protein